jgi:hypothetical protein
VVINISLFHAIFNGKLVGQIFAFAEIAEAYIIILISSYNSNLSPQTEDMITNRPVSRYVCSLAVCLPKLSTCMLITQPQM